MDRDERNFLRAIVSIYITNGLVALDAANEPRSLMSLEWPDAAQMTEELTARGYLETVREKFIVRPTAEGVFEAICP